MQVEREFILDTISDLHKDAYGFRPSNFASFRAMNDDQLQAVYHDLVAAVQSSIEEDKRREAAASDEWNAHIIHLMEVGAKDRATAIRWDMDAMGAGPDVGYYCYLCGLSYDMEAGISTFLKVRELQ